MCILKSCVTHFILISLFGFLSFSSDSEAAPIYSDYACTTGSYFRPNTTYQTNLKLLLSSLVSNATLHNGFYRTSVAKVRRALAPPSSAMKRSFPWVEEQIDMSSYDSSSSNSPPLPSSHFPLPHPPIHLTSQDVLIRRAEMYQDYMKQIPIPSHRGSIIPFTSWMGLGRSIKQLYGQPLHYLTNILLKQWDQLRIGSNDEYTSLDNIIHPCKAEATIWLMEEVHRQTLSPVQIADLWKEDPMYNAFVDSIFPTLEHAP